MIVPDQSILDEGDLYFSARLQGERVLCISLLTDEEALAAGLPADEYGSYFLYQQESAEPADVTLLARVLSAEAALTLSQLLKME